MQFLQLLMKIRTPVMDYFMLGVSWLGTPFFAAGLILWIYLNVSKKTACGIGISFLLSCMICQGIKVLVRMPRPWILEPDRTVFSPAEIALHTATGYSFPSIHAQTAACICESLLHYNKKKAVTVPSVILLFLIPFSRMYLGFHTPVDVIAGFAAATAVNLLVWHFWPRVSNKTGGDGAIAFFIAGLACVLFFMSLALYRNGTVELHLIKDAMQTAGIAAGFAAAFYIERRFIRFSTGGTRVQKLLRFAIALAGFFIISFLTKIISDTSAVLTVLRYLIGGLWLFGAAPFVFVRTGLMKKES